MVGNGLKKEAADEGSETDTAKQNDILILHNGSQTPLIPINLHNDKQHRSFIVQYVQS